MNLSDPPSGLEPGQQPFHVLLERARVGGESALPALAERYGDRLLQRIRLMMGEPARRGAESVDFLHGVFVEVLEKPPAFEGHDERSFLRYLTAIARNNIRDQARRQSIRSFESLSDSFWGGVGGHSGVRTPSMEADRMERLDLLLEALEELEDSDRELVRLRALEGLAWEEVGARVDKAADAARMAYRRAMLRLGEQLVRLSN